jgi:hypothetical protein
VCRSFVFLDAVGAFGVVRASQAKGTQTDDDLPSYGGGMLGFMVNADSSHSIGASAEYDYSFSGRGSVKAHWRRWLGNRSSFDVAAGPLAVDVFRRGNGGDQRVTVHGFTADIAFISRQGIGVYAGVDHIGVTQTPSAGFHVGARLESWWAMAAGGVTAALFAVVWGGVGG